MIDLTIDCIPKHVKDIFSDDSMRSFHMVCRLYAHLSFSSVGQVVVEPSEMGLVLICMEKAGLEKSVSVPVPKFQLFD